MWIFDEGDVLTLIRRLKEHQQRWWLLSIWSSVFFHNDQLQEKEMELGVSASPASAVGGVVIVFTIQYSPTLHQVQPSPIVVSAPMSLFQTEKTRSFKIAIFGPFPLGMTFPIGARRSGLYRGKYKEILDNGEAMGLDYPPHALFPPSAGHGLVIFFTLQTSPHRSRVSECPIVATAPMTHFQTEKTRWPKIPKFGPDGVPMTKPIGAARSRAYRANTKNSTASWS